MRFPRVVGSLRLLLALLFTAGLAPGVAAQRGHPTAAAPRAAAVLGQPSSRLPAPAHSEATCAFCQAGMVPASLPPPAAVVSCAGSDLRAEPGSADEQAPPLSTGRPASSRAPPRLRFA